MSYCQISHKTIEISYPQAQQILSCIALENTHYLFLTRMGYLFFIQIRNNSCSQILPRIDPNDKKNQIDGQLIIEIKKIDDQKILILTDKSIYLFDFQLTLVKPHLRKKYKLCIGLQNHYNKQIDVSKEKKEFIYGARISNSNVLYEIYNIQKRDEEVSPIKPKISEVHQVSYKHLMCIHFPFMLNFTPQIVKKHLFQLQSIKYDEFKKFKISCVRNDLSFLQAIPVDPFGNLDRATFALVGNKMNEEKIVIWVYNFDFDYTVNIIEYSGCCLHAIPHPQKTIQIMLHEQILSEACITNRHKHKNINILRKIQVYYPTALQQQFNLNDRQFLHFDKDYIVSSKMKEDETLISISRVISKKMIYLSLVQKLQEKQQNQLPVYSILYENILQLL